MQIGASLKHGLQCALSSLQQSVKELRYGLALLSLKSRFPTRNKWLNALSRLGMSLAKVESIKCLSVLFRSKGRMDPLMNQEAGDSSVLRVLLQAALVKKDLMVKFFNGYVL